MSKKYSTAIKWLMANDELSWLADEHECSHAACLVADVFERTESEVRHAVGAELKRQAKRQSRSSKGARTCHFIT